jgi:hypothetical protein
MVQHDHDIPAEYLEMEEYEREGTILFCCDSFLQRSSLDLAHHLLSIYLPLVPCAIFMDNGFFMAFCGL